MPTFTYDDAKFRALFPEFSDTTKYPASQIEVYWDLASSFVDETDFPGRILTGAALENAVYLLTAHLYTLALQAQAAVAQGQAPGSNQGGFETSATIDKISVTMLAPPAKDMWEWWLAQTPYGQQLLALLQLLAVGGMSVGGLPERLAFRKVGGIFL